MLKKTLSGRSKPKSSRNQKYRRPAENNNTIHLRTTPTSHPATGFYPSEDSESTSTTSTFKYSKKSVESRTESLSDGDDYDSTEEYQVVFPTIELKMPRQRRRRSSKPRPAENNEHVTITKCVDRREVYGDRDAKKSVSEYTTYTCSTHPDRSSAHLSDRHSSNPHSSASNATDVTYQTYNSTHRLQSLGNFFTSIIEFFRNNPKMTKFLLGIILCYVVVCNLEILIPKVIALIVRLIYPWARYWAVVTEQLFTTIANSFTRLDAVIYASYCEFAAKYCRSRRLMCDVTCSFVDHVLSQARPNLASIPQNK